MGDPNDRPHRDDRMAGDERDERDIRAPGDPRDVRDPREPGDPLDETQISEAAAAVYDRYAKFKRQIFTAVTVMSLVTIVMGAFIVKTNRDLVHTQVKAQLALSCAIAAETKVNAETLASFAKRFGAPPPPIPGLPHECGGKDPVFVGTNHDDTIIGTLDPDWINGEEGDDHLYARGGGDTLIGYKGRDYLAGGIGSDYLYGGDSQDELHGGGDSAVDHLDGGAGIDICFVRPNDISRNCEQIVRVS